MTYLLVLPPLTMPWHWDVLEALSEFDITDISAFRFWTLSFSFTQLLASTAELSGTWMVLDKQTALCLELPVMAMPLLSCRKRRRLFEMGTFFRSGPFERDTSSLKELLTNHPWFPNSKIDYKNKTVKLEIHILTLNCPILAALICNWYMLNGCL